MSTKSKAEIIFATDVETEFRRMSILYNGSRLNKRDTATVIYMMTIHTCIVYDTLLTVHQDNPRRFLFSILKSTDEFDVFTFCRDCDRIDSILVLGISAKSLTSYIRRVEDDYCRRLIGGLVTHNVPLMPIIHQILTFCKRINITSTECEEKTRTAFTQNRERVMSFNRTGSESPEEAAILAEWLASYQPPTLDDCKFGSGRTADQTIQSLGEKYSNMYETERTHYFCVRNGLVESEYTWKGPTHSRCKFVPKSYKSYRTIAMEPHQLMFYQQGVMRSLDRVFQQRLSRRINLHDQSRNRRLAQEGSRTGMYATIDLTSASDSVSLRLIRRWFRNTPCYIDIMTLRSGSMELDNEIIEVPWYAGMGSALCFPIECLVFAAQCEATIRAAGVDPKYSNYCVYGDDIIIESEFAEALIERLKRNGFLPNEEKSFWTGPFREACGGEYYNGDDVTSLKVARKFTSDLASPNSYSSLISLANSCFSRGFFVARRYIISLLKRVNDTILPWTNDHGVLDDEGISSAKLFTPSDISHTFVYDPDLQRMRQQSLCVKAGVVRDTTTEVGRLLAVLHKPEEYPYCESFSGFSEAMRAVCRTVGRSRPVLRRNID